MASLEEIYRRYSRDVYRYAYWISGDATEAEDLTSESFVRAWAGAEDLRAATVKAYLFTIAHNLFLQRRRRADRQVELDPELPDPAPGPDRLVEQRGEVRALLKAMQALPVVDRAALLMRAEHSLPYEEIARSLGLSLSAVKVKVHRARIKLASLLRS